jgi:hypothetical protein
MMIYLLALQSLLSEYSYVGDLCSGLVRMPPCILGHVCGTENMSASDSASRGVVGCDGGLYCGYSFFGLRFEMMRFDEFTSADGGQARQPCA